MHQQLLFTAVIAVLCQELTCFNPSTYLSDSDIFLPEKKKTVQLFLGY